MTLQLFVIEQVAHIELYYLIQRYKFESNSQRCASACFWAIGCIIWYKDTNLKAIHNLAGCFAVTVLLYYLIQRYKFESNSQHSGSLPRSTSGCIIWYKDTNLKAIHNIRLWCTNGKTVVLSDTKIQIWKQFTTS